MMSLNPHPQKSSKPARPSFIFRTQIVFTNFLGLESGNNVAVCGGQKALGFHPKKS